MIFPPVANNEGPCLEGNGRDRGSTRDVRAEYSELVMANRKGSVACVVDTSSFSPAHWSPGELSDFWQEAILLYASQVVLPDRWNLNEDLVGVFRTALQADCKILDARGEPITIKLAMRLVREGAEHADKCGGDGSRFRRALKDIIDLTSVA